MKTKKGWSFLMSNQLKRAYHNMSETIKKNQNMDLSTLPAREKRQDQALEKKVLKDLESLYKEEGKDFQLRIFNEIFRFGPLEDLFKDEEINEIFVNSPESIWFEKKGEICSHQDHFFSLLSYRNSLQRLCDEAGVSIHLEVPFANGRWRDFRLHIIEPPLTSTFTHLSLRRHKVSPWNFSQFIELNWAPKEALFQIQNMIKRRDNFIIVGPTGSGKTSVLNACLQELKPEERAIVIEDTNEIALPNSISVKLLSRRDPHGELRSYSQSDLVYQSLRMRPDRLIVGEVRGAEAKDLLMALATGHRGSLSTLHAEDAHQALLRLEMLIQMGVPQWNQKAIRQLIRLSLHYILLVSFKNKKRSLESIYKITSLEESGFLLEKTF